MKSQGVKPDVISYRTAIVACEKLQQWDKALALLLAMTSQGVEPDVICYLGGQLLC